MTREIHAGDVEFAHDQTFFGFVLMVRRAVPGYGLGDWVWSKWRKADFGDFAEYYRWREAQ